MVVGLLLVALLTAAWALWIRRTARGCRWEGAPSLAVLSAALATYLGSPHASKWIGEPIHALTGKYNVEDFIGHTFGVLCCMAAVYMCLVRLADLETVQVYYTQWVVRPVTVAYMLMLGTWALSPAGEVPALRFTELEGGPWLVAYWTIKCGIGLYLLGLAARVVWLLRRDGKTAVLNMYLATFGMTSAFLVLLHWQAVTAYQTQNAVWVLGYACLIMWAITPAYSWLRRSRALRIPNAIPLALRTPSADE